MAGNSIRSLYIDLGEWEIQVVSDNDQVDSRLRENFGGRSRVTPWNRRERLTCEVVTDESRIREIQDSVEFPDTEIKASKGVAVRYGFSGGRIYLDIAHTAIAEIDPRNPVLTRVYRKSSIAEPGGAIGAPAPPDGSPRRRVVPEPEAFFYPLLAEWIRSFHACLLHCGAVSMGGKAVVFTGPPGSGKSTLVLRILERGGRFLADDLAILRRNGNDLEMLPFREVANVRRVSMERFPELARLASCPFRCEEKYQVDIPAAYGQSLPDRAAPGAVVHLHPSERQWLNVCADGDKFSGMHSMAWFASRADRNREHFELLTDWLSSSKHWHVSQGYLAARLDEFLEQVGNGLRDDP